MTPLHAIRQYCLDCAGETAHDVKLCDINTCPLHSFRLGHNPSRAGLGGTNNEQKPNSAPDIQVLEQGEV